MVGAGITGSVAVESLLFEMIQDRPFLGNVFLGTITENNLIRGHNSRRARIDLYYTGLDASVLDALGVLSLSSWYRLSVYIL